MAVWLDDLHSNPCAALELDVQKKLVTCCLLWFVKDKSMWLYQLTWMYFIVISGGRRILVTWIGVILKKRQKISSWHWTQIVADKCRMCAEQNRIGHFATFRSDRYSFLSHYHWGKVRSDVTNWLITGNIWLLSWNDSMSRLLVVW